MPYISSHTADAGCDCGCVDSQVSSPHCAGPFIFRFVSLYFDCRVNFLDFISFVSFCFAVYSEVLAIIKLITSILYPDCRQLSARRAH